MVQPNWAKLLEAMYRDESHGSYPSEIGEDHPLVQKTGISVDEVIEARKTLRENGWIQFTRLEDSSNQKFSLSAEGFELAHERDLRERQERLQRQQKEINQTSVQVYRFLVIAVGLQALATAATVDYPFNLIIVILALLVFGSLIYITR